MSVLPVTVIRTTAGLTLAATAMVADVSSMVTGLTAPTAVPARRRWSRRPGCGRGRRVAPSARTVPPEARTADSSAAAMTGPSRSAARSSALTATAGAGAAAGSYQRSGVGVAGGASYVRIQSGRASGVGE